MHQIYDRIVARGIGFAATADPSRNVIDAIELLRWRIIARYENHLYQCVDPEDGNKYLIKGNESGQNGWAVALPQLPLLLHTEGTIK